METCPICHGPSFNGEPCHPQCDPGALRSAGIELCPMEGLLETAGNGVDDVKQKTRRQSPPHLTSREVF